MTINWKGKGTGRKGNGMETFKQPLDAGEKKLGLYLRQKELLDTFLEHGAITQAQYDKSLGDLVLKMGIGQTVDENAGQM